MGRRQSQVMAYFVLGSTVAFAVLYVAYLLHALAGVKLGWFAIGLLGFKTAVEIVASFYGFAFVFGAVAYLLLKETPRQPGIVSRCPPLGIIYLCCNDLDESALQSLATLKYRGQVHLIVHDDSKSPAAQAEVDAAVERLRRQRACAITVLRRPHKAGGKPGAVNYVLEQTGHRYEYFMLCDNDSTALDPLTIEKALPYFEDDRVAIVQCRSVAVDSPDYSPVNRLLARSIDAFHVFFAVQSRYGWQPFIGHNAFLRTQAVREVGWFTPGFFSDDLDLTVRLNLKGYAVAYAPELPIGEKHPPSYTSFRKRSYKWAYGCMQSLKAHARAVLTSPRFDLAQKLSFFQFAGFYVGQTFLLAYLALTFLVVPLFLKVYPIGLLTSLISGSVIVLLIFLPTLVYFLKERRASGCLVTIVACGLVYGSTDFSCARGVWDCLWNRDKEWTPTNSVSHSSGKLGLLAEALFGSLLLVVPALAFPALLYLPCSFLFGAKFLFGPAMSLLYDDRATRVVPPLWRSRFAPAAALLIFAFVPLAFFAKSHAGHPAVETTHVTISGKDLYVNGHKFLVKGVSYGPWRPGTGPNKGYPYPSRQEIEEDLRLIQKLNANTILVYDPPDYVLDLADQYGLKVLYCFSVNWWSIGSPQFAPDQEKILHRVEQVRHKPALLAWVLGNEIPVYALTQRGDETIRKGLEDLYHAVKAEDTLHPITYSNWPSTKDLNLSFLDFTSFNLYPLWPPEVVARGYGNYIKDVLQPIAGKKPLLMTEYGVNTIEAGEDGQVRLIKQCWQDLTRAGACGGVAFEFADQWWKNYNNPRRQGDWWDRVPAPDDEKTDDLDPEEHYGLMTAYRHPKPAYSVVAQMYAATLTEEVRAIPLFISTGLIVLAFFTWLWAKRRIRPEALPTSEPAQVKQSPDINGVAVR